MTARTIRLNLVAAPMICATLVLAPVARADDNCVDRGFGMRLCRNPDNTLTFCGAGPLATCQVMTPELMPILGPGPLPPPAPAF